MDECLYLFMAGPRSTRTRRNLRLCCSLEKFQIGAFLIFFHPTNDRKRVIHSWIPPIANQSPHWPRYLLSFFLSVESLGSNFLTHFSPTSLLPANFIEQRSNLNNSVMDGKNEETINNFLQSSLDTIHSSMEFMLRIVVVKKKRFMQKSSSFCNTKSTSI